MPKQIAQLRLESGLFDPDSGHPGSPRTASCNVLMYVYVLHTELLYLFIYLSRTAACGILGPRPGIEPVPPELEERSLNHWTAGPPGKSPSLSFEGFSA